MLFESKLRLINNNNNHYKFIEQIKKNNLLYIILNKSFLHMYFVFFYRCLKHGISIFAINFLGVKNGKLAKKRKNSKMRAICEHECELVRVFAL